MLFLQKKLVNIKYQKIILKPLHHRNQECIWIYFEAKRKGTSYSIRSQESIIQAAKQKAGIIKMGSMNIMRLSFATHLLDKGPYIRYIKDLLGHFNLKATKRYLHVSKKQLVNIINPFDDLWRTNKIDCRLD